MKHALPLAAALSLAVLLLLAALLLSGCQQQNATQQQKDCAHNVCNLPQNRGACGDPEMEKALVQAACGTAQAPASDAL